VDVCVFKGEYLGSVLEPRKTKNSPRQVQSFCPARQPDVAVHLNPTKHPSRLTAKALGNHCLSGSEDFIGLNHEAV